MESIGPRHLPPFNFYPPEICSQCLGCIVVVLYHWLLYILRKNEFELLSHIIF